MFVYEGWFAITETRGGPSFWAAWWTGEPCSSPWRTPDATGVGSQPEAFLAAEAQRRIRAVKGEKALVREMDASWARAAQREAAGESPRYQPPPKTRKPRSEFRRNARPKSAYEQARAQQQKALEAELEALRAAAEQAAAEMRAALEALLRRPGAPVAAFTLLGLPVSATAEDIGRAYRRKVAIDRIHPDQGGDAATFRAVTEARDRALAYAGGGALRDAAA